MIDYHIHTHLSDGKNSHLEIINQAIEMGLTELGFSDHLCLLQPDWAVRKDNFQVMIDRILELKKVSRFISVKFGAEVDYFEGREIEIQNLMNQFPLDYAIGSVHYVNDWNFDSNMNDYEKKDIDKLNQNYYKLLQKAAGSKLFDIMGHIDVVKKFNFYPSFNLKTVFEQTAKILSKSGVAFEINTSGKDKPCNEFYPSDLFLNYCFNNNVPVTFGSDTHCINHLSRYYSEAINKLKITGYRKIAVFDKRKRSFIPI